MKVKVSEASSGSLLDWLVCRAMYPHADMSVTHVWLDTGDGEEDFLIDETSTDWAFGGPIIERGGITVVNAGNLGHEEPWMAAYPTRFGDHSDYIFGPTPLIAAMRCYVTSELGGVVEVPDEVYEALKA
jgi:Protein of unknown function (DUF2591)